jgi:peptidoglycan/LPS O-acetylase OafA/YrhL
LSPGLSLYLDASRFGAALAVLLTHLWPLAFPLIPLPWPGHEAVVVFFVLSGYVISHAAGRPGENASRFVLHRSARILSVTWPALLLAALIAPAVSSQALPLAGRLSDGPLDFAWRTGVNALFMGQSWGLDIAPPFNAPYWSLNFEVWYYVLFGVWTYGSRSARPWLLALACLLAGPKVLLMGPLWLLGVAAQRWSPHWHARRASLLFVLSLLAALALFHFDVSRQIRAWAITHWPAIWAELDGANQFIGDYLLGLCVALNFMAASRLPTLLHLLQPIERLIRLLASFTLSTYLYHMPVAALIWVGAGIREPLPFLGLTLLGIAALGSMTERQLPLARRAVAALVSWLAPPQARSTS